VFLDVLRRRNPAFLEAAIALHQAGQLPPNCYLLDLDAIRFNSAAIRREADRLGLQVFAMTKQVGRARGFIQAIKAGGITAGVAVDMTDAQAIDAAGLRVGHLGHLVQVPQHQAATAAALAPDNWTVFSHDKAGEAAAVSTDQALLLRIHAGGDTFYEGHEGGFDADQVVKAAEAIDALDGVHFAGITTFPALLYDPNAKRVTPTPNLATLERARAQLAAAGRDQLRVNAPGTTSAAVLSLLADHGATQVEPGHGLTGTTPLHAVRDLDELPAVCYLTEVSHLHAGRAYVFGGGLYIDPVFPDYQPIALLAERPGLDGASVVDASIPPAPAIDYYGQLDYTGPPPRTGATVIFGFRIQAFVTRASIAGIRGIGTGTPQVTGIWTTDGREARWP
jgi:predicted amino acid racemase